MSKSKKPTIEELKKQFLDIIECLGIEGIRVSGFKKTFKDYPELLAMVDEVQKAQQLSRHYVPYFGPTAPSSENVENNFGR